MEIDVAIGKYRRSANWQNTQMQWRDLAERCSKTIRTHERYVEYLLMPKPRQDEIKDVGGFVGGFLDRGKRTKDAVLSKQIITLDADFAKPGLWEDYCSIFGAAAFMYSTHKHSPDKPRLRLVILADRPMDKDEYEPVCRYVTNTLGINQFDHTTYDVNRLMYWPSTASDGEFIFENCDGRPLSVDGILATYTDFRDASSWPVGDVENQAIKTGIERQGEPSEKPGTIGLFCRTYTITEAISEFLSEVYEPCDIDGRYTFREGSTAAGLIVYDDKFAYSHHGSDPISEKLVNAFDLVRIHKFGHLDENSRPETPINRLPSYTAMTGFALDLKDVKRLSMEEKLEEMRGDFKDPVFTEADLDWMERLSTDKHGNLYKTYENVEVIMRNDPSLRGRFRFNEFSGQIDIQHPTPWNHRPALAPMTDDDERGLRAYIGKEPYSIVSPGLIGDIYPLIAKENAYHPVKEYLESLHWDGVHRVDSLLSDYLGAEESELNRAFIRKTLCAAVKRIYMPGVKFDTVLTLVGPEGARKSTLAKSLGGPWFTDTFSFSMLSGGNGVRAYEQIQGRWIIEIPEMAGLRKAELEASKNFLGAGEDRFRASHDKKPSIFPRQCIFIGTTNNFMFLTGSTGNRRYWPVQVHVRRPKIRIPGELIDKTTVGQIWAEVMSLWETEPLFLSEELETLARNAQYEHTEVDEAEGIISEYLDMPLPAGWSDMQTHQRAAFFEYDSDKYEGPTERRVTVCVPEIWCEALGRNLKELTMAKSREIHAYMRNRKTDWEGPAAGRFGIYGTQRGYTRKT